MLRTLTLPVVYLMERWLAGPLILAIIAAIAALAVVTIAMMPLAPKKDEEIATAPDRVFDRPGGDDDGEATASRSLGSGAGAEADAPAAVTSRTTRTPEEWVEGSRGLTTILDAALPGLPAGGQPP